jgi:hypothetical protein
VATSLTISILADVSKAVAGIDKIENRTKSWGEKMQGVAMTIGGAFSTQKIVSTVEGWVNAGLDAKGAMKNVGLVFGESARGVNEWADAGAKTFGMTAAEAEKGAAKIGVALVGMGYSHADAARMSMALMQRTADVAKTTGTDQESVLSKVETAFRGRTAGLKDYGVQVEKGASSSQIFNAFMQDTAQYAGRANTPMAALHATMGDLSAELGLALIPVISTFLPLLQSIGDFAKRNKVAFDIIVIALAAVALAFSIATVAAGAFGITTWAGLWPILAVVGAIIALIAIIAVVIRYWHDITAALAVAWGWIENVGQKWWWLILLFGGPLGAVIVAVTNFKRIWPEIEAVVLDVWRAVQKVIDIAGRIATGAIDAFKGAWHGVEDAVNAVKRAIEGVINIAKTAADKVGDVLSKIPLINKIPGISGLSAGAAPATYGPSAYGPAPVVFSPTITITGDVGDPVLAGRRIVNALEAWTAANGRRRIASLVAP